MSLPITLIVDDPAPLINVYWWHVAEVQATEFPVSASGEPVARTIPNSFLHQFADVVSRWGIKGKFSVLPYPAGLGAITDGWPGCDERELNTWLDVVRRRITPQMDITPEILTHAKALDLDTRTLLPENERHWSRSQNASTLTPYIRYALEILNAVDLKATGITSPWDFGIEVEDEYQRAMRDAMRDANGRSRIWYFLHQENERTDFCSRVVHRRDDAWQVSLCSQVSDKIWNTMNSLETGADYLRSVADEYLSEDGSNGRLAELFQAGTPIVWCTHWQSLYANGRTTGLQTLDEICRRINALWGTGASWLKCSELAAAVANPGAGKEGEER